MRPTQGILLHTSPTPDTPKYGYLPVGTGLAVVLLPVGVAFWVVVSFLRMVIHAIPWLTLWVVGYLLFGGLAQLLRVAFAMECSVPRAWAVGGAIGVFAMSLLHGLTTAAWFWAARHRMNPYQSDTPLRQPRIHEPQLLNGRLLLAAVMSCCMAGACPAWLLISQGSLGSRQSAVAFWPHIGIWILVGGCGLALEGLLMGLVLGMRQSRPELDLANRSFGEAVGSLIAGPQAKTSGAIGWAIGYALHQAPLGLIAGLGLGVLTWLVK